MHDMVYQSPWTTKIKNTLDDLGMSNLWIDGDVINEKWFKVSVNQKLSDIGAQSWNTETQTNGLFTTYRIFKITQSFEKYLVELDPKDRINLCKFRYGSHRLPINTGRFVNVNRDERICGLCTEQKRGDEFHYLFDCQALKVERSECLKKYYRTRPNTLKMEQLFNSKNKKELSKLARFCRVIMQRF